VLAFVGALDAVYRDDGVGASAVLRSVIDSPADCRDRTDAHLSRWVRPEAIARVIRLLCFGDSAPTGGVPDNGRAWPGALPR
jgi:hypothetical protein